MRPLGVINQEIGDFRRDSAVRLSIQHDRGRQRAITEAEDWFDGEAAVGRGLAQFDSQAIFDVLDHLVAAHGLAGFGAAHLQNVASARGAAKIVIEADDSVHFGMGND